MTQMMKGANVPIAASALRATLLWSGGPGVPDVDASALLVQADGKVSSDADFVYYNQPQHPSGAVRHLGKSSGAQFSDVMEIDLGQVPPGFDRVVLAASADGGTFGQVPDLVLVLADRVSGGELARFAMTATTETAFVGGELYRHSGSWKFRAVGQGYSSGLGGLAADFGIGVDGSGAASPATAPAAIPVQAAAPAAPPAQVQTAPSVPAPALAQVPQFVAPPPVAAPPVQLTPPAPDYPPQQYVPPPAAEASAPDYQQPAYMAPPAPQPLPPPTAAASAPDYQQPAYVAPPAPQPLPPPTAETPAPNYQQPPYVAPPAPQPLPPPTADAPAPNYQQPPYVALPAPQPLPPPTVETPAPPYPLAPYPRAGAAEYSAQPPAPPAPVPAPAQAPRTPTPTPTLILRHDEWTSLARPDGTPLQKLVVGAGWQPVPGVANIDLDASVIAFDAQGNELEIVWHRNANEFMGALQHTGDNKTGVAEGDAEEILVDLPRLPEQVSALVFTITSFTGQRFTDIARAYFRMADQLTGHEVVRFDLSDTQPSTAVLMAILRRGGTEVWGVRAIGEFHDTRFVKKLVEPAARHVRMT